MQVLDLERIAELQKIGPYEEFIEMYKNTWDPKTADLHTLKGTSDNLGLAGIANYVRDHKEPCEEQLNILYKATMDELCRLNIIKQA